MLYKPSQATWLNPNIEYLFGEEIIEYDISDAGFSLIKEYSLLTDRKIRELEGLGKGIERHVAIGKLRGENKGFSEALSQKFSEVREKFIIGNGLTDDQIISVKNDAIYTIGRCKKTSAGVVKFRSKNKYSSYVRLSSINNLEIYFSDEGIDIKGMGDSAVNRHRIYLVEFLEKIIGMIERHDENVKRFIIKFADEYKTQKLDMEFYLEFNNRSIDIRPDFNFQNLIVPLILIILKEM